MPVHPLPIVSIVAIVIVDFELLGIPVGGTVIGSASFAAKSATGRRDIFFMGMPDGALNITTVERRRAGRIELAYHADAQSINSVEVGSARDLKVGYSALHKSSNSNNPEIQFDVV